MSVRQPSWPALYASFWTTRRPVVPALTVVDTPPGTAFWAIGVNAVNVGPQTAPPVASIVPQAPATNSGLESPACCAWQLRSPPVTTCVSGPAASPASALCAAAGAAQERIRQPATASTRNTGLR